MSGKIPKATHFGEVKIGAIALPCFVLDDGQTRLVSQAGLLQAIGRSKTARIAKSREHSDGVNLPPFLQAKNLKPFISNELATASSQPILFSRPFGGRAYGYPAELLPQICQVYIDAKDKGVLLPAQHPVAETAKILLHGFAHVGIIALIDAATGFEIIRDKRALQEILDKYLLKEYAKWAKRFPDDFYKELFRLRRWQWQGMKLNRPSVVGAYTNDVVYARLAPSVLDELRKRNPPDERGNRRAKHHQYLTPDIGHTALQQHLFAVLALMRASSDWDKFRRSLARAFPVLSGQLELKEEDQ